MRLGRVLRVVLVVGIGAGSGSPASGGSSAVFKDAVERDHHAEGGHDVFVLDHVERVGVAKAQPLLGDGGDGLLALLDGVFMMQKVAAHFPVAVRGFQRVVRVDDVEVTLSSISSMPSQVMK